MAEQRLPPSDGMPHSFASPANVHRSHPPAPTGPNLAPTCAPATPTTTPTIVPIVAPPPIRAPGSVRIPGGCAGKTQADARRNSRTAPTPTTSAPSHSRSHSRASSAPGTSAPSATTPPASSDPDAMKAAAPEGGPCRGVGGNKGDAQGCDHHCNERFLQHEDLPSLKRRRQNPSGARWFLDWIIPARAFGVIPDPCLGASPRGGSCLGLVALNPHAIAAAPVRHARAIAPAGACA